MQATSVGGKETEATTVLEKKVKAKPEMTYEEAVQAAIAALQVSIVQCASCLYGTAGAIIHTALDGNTLHMPMLGGLVAHFDAYGAKMGWEAGVGSYTMHCLGA